MRPTSPQTEQQPKSQDFREMAEPSVEIYELREGSKQKAVGSVTLGLSFQYELLQPAWGNSSLCEDAESKSPTQSLITLF